MRDDSELESLALFVHGALAALHALGLVYNLRRGNRLDAIAHAIGLAYDAGAALEHLRGLNGEPG